MDIDPQIQNPGPETNNRLVDAAKFLGHTALGAVVGYAGAKIGIALGETMMDTSEKSEQIITAGAAVMLAGAQPFKSRKSD